MRRERVLILAICLVFLLVQIFARPENPIANGQDELEKILKRCAEYCEKLTHSVLDFVCRERITEEINTVDFKKRDIIEDRAGKSSIMSSVWKKGNELNSFVYDYQMIRKDGLITDRRILIRENGIKKYEVNAEPKIKRFKHHNILFGPIALLDLQWQPFYDYKIVRKEKFKRVNAVVIEAIPRETNTSENPFGKVWVREDDYSIVKIEWDQKSLPNLDVFENDAKNFRARPEIKFSVEYGFEKSGIRFPSKYAVVETYYRGESVYFIRSRMDTVYDRYKFFTVETEVKY